MPGFRFAGGEGGYVGVPDIDKFLLANSLAGTGTPPAAALYTGDVVVTTTKSTLTSSGNVVLRQLLAADKTAHYKEGTPVAGLMGVCMSDVATNAAGAAISPPPIAPGLTSGAGIQYPLSESTMWGADRASGRNYGKVALFLPGNVFIGRLDMTAGAITLQHQYDDTLCGLIIAVSGGVSTFTIDTNAAAADQCFRILGPNEQDPLYNTLVAAGASVQGPSVFFEIVPAFAQRLTGVNYSTQ